MLSWWFLGYIGGASVASLVCGLMMGESDSTFDLQFGVPAPVVVATWPVFVAIVAVSLPFVALFGIGRWIGGRWGEVE